MNRVKRALASTGVAAMLVGGVSAIPAQAADNYGSCTVRVTHVGANLYKTERYCKVFSLIDTKVKVSESYFLADFEPRVV